MVKMVDLCYVYFTTNKNKNENEKINWHSQSCYFSKLEFPVLGKQMFRKQRKCPRSLRILSKVTKILCPWGERQNGALGTSSASGLPWWAWLADPWPHPETGRRGPPRNDALLGVWPARRRSLQALVDPELACLPRPSHPFQPLTLPDCTPGVRFVTPVLTASSTSEPGFDLASQDPVSVEVHQSFGSTGYYPHSIPGRWLISTLADLCVLTFWLLGL